MQSTPNTGRARYPQSLAARIVRALQHALRFGMSAPKIRVFVKTVLSGAELPELRLYATPDEEWPS
jgi:hypothetical protein